MFTYGFLEMDTSVLADQQDLTYTYQLCAGIGCSLEDLPGAMDDRDGLRVRVKGVCAISMN